MPHKTQLIVTILVAVLVVVSSQRAQPKEVRQQELLDLIEKYRPDVPEEFQDNLDEMRKAVESWQPSTSEQAGTTGGPLAPSAAQQTSPQGGPATQSMQGNPVLRGGRLRLQAVGTSWCPGGTGFVPGQAIELRGEGFDSGASVALTFEEQSGVTSSLGTATADGFGALNTTVTVPIGYAIPTSARIDALGSAPAGETRYLSILVNLGHHALDSDSDSVPDFCDNCPTVANSLQNDTDADGLGDACDLCPADSADDVDSDGLCADVDLCPYDAANDADGDGVCESSDNCPTVHNPSQFDSDANGVGDACQTQSSCSDGFDNDNDGRIDFPQDRGCDSATDETETNPAIPCDDGIDNDADGLIDYRPLLAGDPGCGFDTDSALPEDPECDDGIDNSDGDGLVDWDGRNGLYDPDPDCQGFGFGPSETVPEPTAEATALAVPALVARYCMWRTRRRPVS